MTRDVEAEAVKFSWKRKRKWKQTRKRLTLCGARSGSKKYSTASTSLGMTDTELVQHPVQTKKNKLLH